MIEKKKKKFGPRTKGTIGNKRLGQNTKTMPAHDRKCRNPYVKKICSNFFFW